MKYLLVRHEVKDYNIWRKVFDQNKVPCHEYGLSHGRIFCGENRNNLVLLFQIESIPRTREFLELEVLKKEMERGGVIGKPEMLFLDELPEPRILETTVAGSVKGVR